MPTETLDGFLDRMATGSAVPGGGAGAAVQAGLAAALVAMAARCTPVERFPDAGPTRQRDRPASPTTCRALRCGSPPSRREGVRAGRVGIPAPEGRRGQRRDRADCRPVGDGERHPTPPRGARAGRADRSDWPSGCCRSRTRTRWPTSPPASRRPAPRARRPGSPWRPTWHSRRHRGAVSVAEQNGRRGHDLGAPASTDRGGLGQAGAVSVLPTSAARSTRPCSPTPSAAPSPLTTASPAR